MNKPGLTVAIQKNPKAGSGFRRAELDKFILAIESHGLSSLLISDRDDFAKQLKSAEFRSSIKCIVAAGGDGTIDDVINRYPDIPISVLPMGNENLLAKQLGILFDGHKLAEIIAKENPREIDLGLAGTHRFAVMASCGFDAEVIDRVHKNRKGHITKLQYLMPIFKTLYQNRRPALKIFTSQNREPITCEFAIIANLSRYAIGLPVCPQAVENNGLFDLCLFKSASRWNLTKLFLQGMLKSKIDSPNLIRLQTDYLKIEADPPVPIQADGDPLGETPMEFRILPQALEIFAPAVLR